MIHCSVLKQHSKIQKSVSFFCLKPEQINRTKKNYQGEKRYFGNKNSGGGGETQIMVSFICAIFGPPVNAGYCLVSTHQAQVSNNMAATIP